jgi:hypothetical protein
MGFKLTWIGMFTSDSGKESILKSVFSKEGLSGIIFFEQQIKKMEEMKTKQNLTGFSMTFQSKRFRFKNGKAEIKF